MKFIKDNIIKYGETLILSDFLRLEEDVDGRVSIRAVVGSGSGMVLDDLADVTISSPVVDQFLRYNGSLWINQLVTAGNVGSGTFKSGGFAFTGPIIVGTDPGSSDGLRVGGEIRLGHAGSVRTTWNSTDAAADSKRWRLYSTNTGTFVVDALNDAESVASTALTFTRSGSTFTGLVVGGDPGGSQLFRVGSGAFFSNRVQVRGAGYGLVNVNVEDGIAAYSLHYPGIVAWQMGRRGSDLVFSTTGGSDHDEMGPNYLRLSTTALSPGSAGLLTLGTSTEPFGVTYILDTAGVYFMSSGGVRRSGLLGNGVDLITFFDNGGVGRLGMTLSAGGSLNPAVSGQLTLGVSSLRWGKFWGQDADFSSDIKIGTNLGTFDSSSVATTDHVLSYNGTKWVSRVLQSSFSSGQVTASQLADLTFSSFVHDGRTPTGSPTAPTSIQDPVATALYRAILVDVSAYGALPADKVFVIDYSINGGGFSTNAIVCTSNKIVHSNLNPANTYSYKYKIRGASDSVYSDATSALNPSNNSEVNAFGVILASQIAAANISAISVNIGDIAAGQVRNPANTAGILFSGTLPGTWTTYMNLVATGINPLLHHPGLDLLANGSAIFSGVVTAGYITMGSGIAISSFSQGTPLIPDDGQSDGYGSASIERGRFTSKQSVSFAGGIAHISFDSRSSDVHLKMRRADVAVDPYWRFISANPDNLYLQAVDGSVGSFGLADNVIFKLSGGMDIASGTTRVTGDLYTPLVVHSGSGIKIIDWREGNVQKFILKAAGQTLKLDRGNLGGVYTLILFQDAVGSKTVTTWTTDDANTTVVWPGGTSPVLSTGANDADIVTFVKVIGSGTNNHYLGVIGGQNYPL